jgi:hypothetical protein
MLKNSQKSLVKQLLYKTAALITMKETIYVLLILDPGI